MSKVMPVIEGGKRYLATNGAIIRDWPGGFYRMVAGRLTCDKCGYSAAPADEVELRQEGGNMLGPCPRGNAVVCPLCKTHMSDIKLTSETS